MFLIHVILLSMPEVLITHFEALVHPDYNLMWSETPVLTPEHVLRRHAWDQRVEEIAQNPQAVLLYFSCFLQSQELKYYLIKDRSSSVYLEESDRIRKYKEKLQERFFSFAGNQYPSAATLERLLQSRGFFHAQVGTTLTVYGEYYDSCVNQWGTRLKTVLGLAGENYAILPRLSLAYSDDPNRHARKFELELLLREVRMMEQMQEFPSTFNVKHPLILP